MIGNGPNRRGRHPASAKDPRHAAGHGLIGMRERAALCGGRLDAGATADGGFRVTAWPPVDHRLPSVPDAVAGAGAGAASR